MPNIEIHGFSGDEAESLRKKIFTSFQDEPYVGQMVVTIYPTSVTDKDSFRQPFVRLVSTPGTFEGEIIKKLKALGLDVEHLRLEAFHPKAEEVARKLQRVSLARGSVAIGDKVEWLDPSLFDSENSRLSQRDHIQKDGPGPFTVIDVTLLLPERRTILVCLNDKTGTKVEIHPSWLVEAK